LLKKKMIKNVSFINDSELLLTSLVLHIYTHVINATCEVHFLSVTNML
jgi:hypothetical protein